MNALAQAKLEKGIGRKLVRGAKAAGKFAVRHPVYARAGIGLAAAAGRGIRAAYVRRKLRRQAMMTPQRPDFHLNLEMNNIRRREDELIS